MSTQSSGPSQLDRILTEPDPLIRLEKLSAYIGDAITKLSTARTARKALLTELRAANTPWTTLVTATGKTERHLRDLIKGGPK